MAGTVFLSCGQNGRELAIAERIAALLQAPPFGLTVFIARSTNNLYSLNNDVLQNLAYADYFLFVNFYRENPGFPGSIYAHQELAMALAVGHERVLLFAEKGAAETGVIQFMVRNRAPFQPPTNSWGRYGKMWHGNNGVPAIAAFSARKNSRSEPTYSLETVSGIP